LKYKTMAEDKFMQQCLDMLNVSSVLDEDLIADERCEPARCNDVTKAAYNPYTTASDWVNCWEESEDMLQFGNVPVDTIRAQVKMRLRKLKLLKLQRLLKLK